MTKRWGFGGIARLETLWPEIEQRLAHGFGIGAIAREFRCSKITLKRVLAAHGAKNPTHSTPGLARLQTHWPAIQQRLMQGMSYTAIALEFTCGYETLTNFLKRQEVIPQSTHPKRGLAHLHDCWPRVQELLEKGLNRHLMAKELHCAEKTLRRFLATKDVPPKPQKSRAVPPERKEVPRLVKSPTMWRIPHVPAPRKPKPKKRECLKCERVFLSTGPENRLCQNCRNFSAASPSPVETHHIGAQAYR